MAYDSRFRVAFLIASSMASAITAALHALTERFSSWSDSATSILYAIDWPDFMPSPRESIALDVAALPEVDARQPGIMSRFAEFVRRALTHEEFTAGHYDPGDAWGYVA